jgi:hypothetical protein
MLVHIDRKTTLTVSNHKDLRRSWSSYSEHARISIGRYKVEKPLTDAQLRRLSAPLRARVLGLGISAS